MTKDLNTKILDQLVNTAPVAMFAVDKDRNIVFANEAYAKIFGYTLDEVINVNAKEFHIDEEHFRRFAKIGFDKVRQGIPVELDYPAKKKNGEHFWIHITGSYLKEDEIVLWTIFDITKTKEAEKRLEELNFNFQEYLNAIDESEIGIFVVNANYQVQYMNNTMKKWFGDQTGKVCYSSIAKLDDKCSYCQIQNVIYENKKVFYEPTTPDGQSFKIIAAPIKNSDGTISKMEIIQNVTEQKMAQEALEKQQELLYHQAHFDALTDLPNRVLLRDRLQEALKRAQRSQTKVAVFFIDLDHFKEINDSLGHNIGDLVLIEATKNIKKVIRQSDTLARLGGDEFIVVAENIKSKKEVKTLANKIQNILRKPLAIQEHNLYISGSIGIALFPDDGEDIDNLLKYADSAMYHAKKLGRNNYQFYSKEMTELAYEHITLQANLKKALKNKELTVYYQPQINAKTFEVIGAEALVRWNHPSLGLILPSKFIPLAESTGIIVEIDRFVMQQAFEDFASLYKKGLNPGVLSLNLSNRQIEQKDFIPFLQKLLDKYQFQHDWLELEITETQIMKNIYEALHILEQLSKYRIKLVIDDFGTGYSSLSYLKKFPFNKLKIDQSFVKELPHCKENVALTKAIIALAQSLNLEVIAEGVEKVEQRDFIIDHGCNNIQGYFCAKPMSMQEFENFIKKRYTFKKT